MTGLEYFNQGLRLFGVAPFRLRRILLGMFTLLILWLVIPPGSLFPDQYSTLIFDRNGELLRFTLAEDEQYRAPPVADDLPEKYKTAVLTWEDKRFYKHPGVDPLAMGRAIWLNLKGSRRVSGGSTITMQVMRLSNPRQRSYYNKLRETLGAVKITLHMPKDSVLKTYSEHVPMGGNVVGIRTAAWCYFGKPAQELTWAEACLFAVLPNAPSMLNLQQGRKALIEKRNQLLSRLFEAGTLDSTTWILSKTEPLPDGRIRLPFKAPHLTEQVIRVDHDTHIQTSLDLELQELVSSKVSSHSAYLKSRGINNLAVLVVETGTGKVRAYLGSQNFFDEAYQGQVDGVQARRSTGSLLKPILAAQALDRGPFTIQSQIQDVPTYFGTFTPQNANKQYSGSASLSEVLVRSLNIPSVRLLNAMGVSDFYEILIDMGFKGLFRGAQGYGLALILGGAEASLWDQVQAYAEMGRMGEPLNLTLLDQPRYMHPRERTLSAGACYQVIQSLQTLSRPGSDHYWQNFSYQVPVSWKTGTSYGQKDGWAVGVTPEFTVGVWVGNFDGEGNVELGGAQSAGPILFDIFNSISGTESVEPFEKPEIDLRFVEICGQSGFPAGPDCPEPEMVEVPLHHHVSGPCKDHRKFILDVDTGEEICSLCWDGHERREEVRYIRPPAVQKVLLEKGHDLVMPPVHKAGCSSARQAEGLQILYPLHGLKVLVPRNLKGTHEKVLLEALHPQANSHLFWIMDQALIGETDSLHTLAVDISQGKHWLTVMDEDGNSKTIGFEAFRTPVGNGSP